MYNAFYSLRHRTQIKIYARQNELRNDGKTQGDIIAATMFSLGAT